MEDIAGWIVAALLGLIAVGGAVYGILKGEKIDIPDLDPIPDPDPDPQPDPDPDPQPEPEEDLDEDLVMRAVINVSSVEKSSTSGTNVRAGREDKRWSSAFHDGEWIALDLGSVRTIKHLRIVWETAFASEYVVETTDDPDGTWTFLQTVRKNSPGVDNIVLPTVRTRHVRIRAVKRATSWGVSIWTLQLFGRSPSSVPNPDPIPDPIPDPTPDPTPDPDPIPDPDPVPPATGDMLLGMNPGFVSYWAFGYMFNDMMKGVTYNRHSAFHIEGNKMWAIFAMGNGCWMPELTLVADEPLKSAKVSGVRTTQERISDRKIKIRFPDADNVDWGEGSHVGLTVEWKDARPRDLHLLVDENVSPEGFNPYWVEAYKDVGIIRPMEIGGANSTFGNKISGKWSERATDNTGFRYRKSNGILSIEQQVEMCNVTGSHLWMSMPHLATDEYITEAMELIRDHMDPGLLLFLEFSNEVWNTAGPYLPQTQHAERVGKRVEGSGNAIELWNAGKAVESARMFKIAKSVLGDRCRTVLMTQLENHYEHQQAAKMWKKYANGAQLDHFGAAVYWRNDTTSSQMRSLDERAEHIESLARHSRDMGARRGLAMYEGGWRHGSKIFDKEQLTNGEQLKVHRYAVNLWKSLGVEAVCLLNDFGPMKKQYEWTTAKHPRQLSPGWQIFKEVKDG